MVPRLPYSSFPDCYKRWRSTATLCFSKCRKSGRQEHRLSRTPKTINLRVPTLELSIVKVASTSHLFFSVSSLHSHIHPTDIFNPTFDPIIATVFGICSSKLFYWLYPICSRLDAPLNKHPYLPIVNCILATATSAHARCAYGFRTWYPTPSLENEHVNLPNRCDVGRRNPC